MPPSSLEIACFTLPSASTALSCPPGTVSRIELCAGPASCGGTMPSLALFASVKALPNPHGIPINVMIRPRAEPSFTCTAADFEQMRDSVIELGDAGADGFVFGILDEQGGVDGERCRELVRLAGENKKKCTFHRAFDRAGDLGEALEVIIGAGFGTVLTSGGRESVGEGAERVKELVEQAKGRVVVMPGGGVRAGNIRELMKRIGKGKGVEWWHSSAVLIEGGEADGGEVWRLRDALRGNGLE